METSILKYYGFGGVIIIGLSWFVMYIMKDHKKERKEWKETNEKQVDKQDERQAETNRIIRENTNILTGLKTLLENKK